MSTATPIEFHRDSLAQHYASRHLAVDAGVEKVFYLPQNAPHREIRFLEINNMISEMTHPEPIDFGVDAGAESEHKLIVLDITPHQWDELQSGRLLLPPGWSLEGSRVFGRNSR